ncbi:MAG: S24 family peptidase [Comamonas sp.]|uniref:S24 family peptidase n=1 Tax=Comamonas sp. TaxID=34028 RepID=UPI002FC99EE1
MEIADIRRLVAQRIVDELTLTVAANRFSMPPRQLLDMLAGRKSFGEKVARRMEQAFDPYRTAGWLDHPLDGTSETVTSPIAAEPRAMYSMSDFTIPQYETGGSMGKGIFLADQPGVIKEWRVSERWLHLNVHRITSPSNLAIVTGFGPSMQPLFNPGDPLLVDRGINTIDQDGIYFFRVGDEGFVKQLQRIPSVHGLIIRAKSYNPLYDPFDIVEGMDLEVFARVVKVWKGEDF